MLQPNQLNDKQEVHQATDEESARLEKLFQTFLNEVIPLDSELTDSFEQYQIPADRLDVYEKRVFTGETILQILEVIFDMFKELQEAIPRYFKSRYHDKKLDPSSLNNLGGKQQSTSDWVSAEYQNLEKVLQKYEAEIREHVRIEQQLKIFVETLQEKVSEKEKEWNQRLDAVNLRVKEKEDKANELSAENKLLKELLRGIHATPANSSINRQRESQESLKNSLVAKQDQWTRRTVGGTLDLANPSKQFAIQGSSMGVNGSSTQRYSSLETSHSSNPAINHPNFLQRIPTQSSIPSGSGPQHYYTNQPSQTARPGTTNKSRNKSRELSPVPAPGSTQRPGTGQAKKRDAYLNNLGHSIKNKKGLPREILFNFKKIGSFRGDVKPTNTLPANASHLPTLEAEPGMRN